MLIHAPVINTRPQGFVHLNKKRGEDEGQRMPAAKALVILVSVAILWRRTVCKDGPKLAMCQGGGQSHSHRVNEVALALLKTAQRSWCYLGNPVWCELIATGTGW